MLISTLSIFIPLIFSENSGKLDQHGMYEKILTCSGAYGLSAMGTNPEAYKAHGAPTSKLGSIEKNL